MDFASGPEEGIACCRAVALAEEAAGTEGWVVAQRPDGQGGGIPASRGWRLCAEPCPVGSREEDARGIFIECGLFLELLYVVLPRPCSIVSPTRGKGFAAS